MSTQFRIRLATWKKKESLLGYFWEHFSFFHSEIYVFMLNFSGQNKFSQVTIFKECLRFVLDLVQILYSIALQCVFPVLLFNPHTSALVWMKTDYNVHISDVLSQPASFPPPHRRGCAWRPLAGAWEAQRASISPQLYACGAGEGSSL